MNNHRPTDSQMITHGLKLLATGILASNLPNRLMAEFGISAAQAKKLAGEAIEKRKQQKAKADG